MIYVHNLIAHREWDVEGTNVRHAGVLHPCECIRFICVLLDLREALLRIRNELQPLLGAQLPVLPQRRDRPGHP